MRLTASSGSAPSIPKRKHHCSGASLSLTAEGSEKVSFACGIHSLRAAAQATLVKFVDDLGRLKSGHIGDVGRHKIRSEPRRQFLGGAGNEPAGEIARKRYLRSDGEGFDTACAKTLGLAEIHP
jgi:hypothetical protein